MKSNTRKKHLFGTDGIRNHAGEGWLANDKVELVARVVGNALHDTPHLLTAQEKPFPNLPPSPRDFSDCPTVLVGRDTRASGPEIQQALAKGFLSQGVDVVDIGVAPTPAVALLAALWECSMAAVISASHNPPGHNGIKFLTQNGFKIPDGAEIELEKKILDGKAPPPCREKGKLHRIEDYAHEYAVIVSHNCISGGLDGMKILLDCANGATQALAPPVFEELGAHVIALNTDSDGASINRGCGSLHAENFCEHVIREGADIGISFDGDGDRAIFIDDKGSVRDGDYTLAICAGYMKEKGRLPGDIVVGTVMANLGLEKALAEIGVELIRMPVGDRYVSEKMVEGGYTLGGEQSGHILFAEHSNTGDGIITALNILEIMRATGRTLSELSSSMRKYPQVLVNVSVREKKPLAEIAPLREIVGRIESDLADRTRLVLRYSGTEPLARVMLEGVDQAEIEQLADRMAQIIRTELG